MRVAVRVDAGPLIGGGHAMRCLTLADALAEGGAEVVFVTAAMPDTLADRIEASGHTLARLGVPAGSDPQGSNWHEQALDPEVQKTDARHCDAAVGRADWVIVDHYLLDHHWHGAARTFASKIMVVDDLANRHYDCDLLVDQTFGRAAAEYRSLVPAHGRVLAGPSYALLRPEFGVERAAALDRRQEPGSVRHILLSMGTADLGGATALILPQVIEAAPASRIDVVLGGQALTRDDVAQIAEGEPRITVHVDSRDMAGLMRDADIAIGAAGTTSWERCCLGLPTIAVVVAENQRPSAAALARAGAVVSVDQAEEVGPVLRGLIADPLRLAQMSAAAFAIVDGQGTSRVTAALLGNEPQRSGTIQLQPATMEDAERLWVWRNDPVTREQSRNTDPITWPSHLKWLRAAFADPRRRIMIASRDGRPVGNIGLHPVSGGEEVSIVVGPSERGQGIGRSMLRLACADATETLYASVRTDNRASRKLFESCGFQPVASSEPGFVRYARHSEHRARKQA